MIRSATEAMRRINQNEEQRLAHEKELAEREAQLHAMKNWVATRLVPRFNAPSPKFPINVTELLAESGNPAWTADARFGLMIYKLLDDNKQHDEPYCYKYAQVIDEFNVFHNRSTHYEIQIVPK